MGEQERGGLGMVKVRQEKMGNGKGGIKDGKKERRERESLLYTTKLLDQSPPTVAKKRRPYTYRL